MIFDFVCSLETVVLLLESWLGLIFALVTFGKLNANEDVGFGREQKEARRYCRRSAFYAGFVVTARFLLVSTRSSKRKCFANKKNLLQFATGKAAPCMVFSFKLCKQTPCTVRALPVDFANVWLDTGKI